MSDKKISQLTTLAQGDIAPTTDVVAIVDTNVPETKKTTADALVKSVLAQATSLPIANADINGGTIDGTAIGSTTPSTGAFTAITENNFPVVTQTDIGTAPNQLPLNQYLGNLAYQDAGSIAGFIGVPLGTATNPSITFSTDTNTGIYSPAADTIAFTEGGVEAMRIDSSGNVGIGTSSPTARFHVKGSNGEIHLQPDADTEYTALTFRNAANNSARGYVLYNYTSNFMSFRTNGSGEAMRIDSSGNVLVGKTTTTANGGDLQVSKGITFPATQSAQSDANTLDDYEEGTFTPTVAGTTTAGTGTYSVQIGRYVKIGKQVTVWVRLTWSAHTGTGKGVIANLPFTSQSISGGNHPFAATVGYEINYDTPANTVLSAYVEPNGTRIFFAQIGVGTQSGVADVDLDTAAGVSVSATYEVA
jgi:hypothetical protein